VHAIDDAQNVTKRISAHTECAFRVNDEFFAEHDARRMETRPRGEGGE